MLRIGSHVRGTRRRLRCMRKGHYWVQRMDAHGNVETFCRRCGGARRREVERVTLDLAGPRVTIGGG